MSLKVNIHQLQKSLPELLDRTVQSDDVCLIERDGQPYAVLVSIREWRRQTFGKRLDALGPQYRLSRAQQRRTEELLARRRTDRLTRSEQRELKELLRAGEEVMLRRAAALDHV
ncbi:MAG TPA: type II toxin-antitoxin system prevent-host-death family antitoxin [Blastocatellia bacterium]|nr:type II toxin-antitoxin system prevent-host-death family antitoxin [Blastocatellia bacterium]